MRSRWPVAVSAALLAACAPAAEPPPFDHDDCHKGALTTLYADIFTFATDQPVYPPWYMGDDPTNGEGFESAVAHAVAARLGYTRDEVRWVRVPFNAALEPGPKTFDANLSEFSITDQRRAAVDFSSPYFDVTQAVVTVRNSRAAGVKTLAALRTLKLGAQVGTTSFTAAEAVNGDVEVYNTNTDAKMALSSGAVDALVADLPTAFSVANELRDGLMVGQLPGDTGDVEQFGIVLGKGSSLTRCVSWAVDDLRADGSLAKFELLWLAEEGRAPVLG